MHAFGSSRIYNQLLVNQMVDWYTISTEKRHLQSYCEYGNFPPPFMLFQIGEIWFEIHPDIQSCSIAIS